MRGKIAMTATKQVTPVLAAECPIQFCESDSARSNSGKCNTYRLYEKPPVATKYGLLERDVGAHLYYADTSQDANTYPTWAALFQRYVSDKGQTNDPTLQSYPPAWDGVSIRQTQSSAEYFLLRQGVLHLAVGLKVPGAQPASTWLDSQIPVQLGKYGGTNDPRWSFDVR
jgi:hypothetical protein